MSKFVEEMHEKRHVAQSIAGKLIRLANAFQVTGNATVAESLVDMSRDLDVLGEDLVAICIDRVDADVKHAEEATGNMIRAAMAVAGKKGA